MKQLLIVAHAPSPNTHALAQALLRGAQHEAIEQVSTQLISPFATQPQQVQQADGIILFTPENFGYMSGALKDFFDRCYYPVLEQKQGLPYALVVRAGLDGTGTQQAVKRIIAGLRWREVLPATLCHGEYNANDFIQRCEECGMSMAAGLDNGIF